MRKKAIRKKIVKKPKNKFSLFGKPKKNAVPLFDKIFETKKKVKKIDMKENISLGVVSTRLFGNIVDKNMKYFESLKIPFDASGLNMMFRTYLSRMFLIALLTHVSSFLIMIILLIVLKANLFYFISGLLIFPSLMTAFIFLYIYSYPEIRSSSRKTSIETNLPFAINHMAAVAESGATPYSIFKVLSHFKEYGEISYESERIVRDMDLFGLDITAAIKETIETSPSEEFKHFLEGILMMIKSGGNLKRYLKEEANSAMLNYRMNRQKYTEMISIYADFYTALLIAAPLIMVAMLAILNTIGGVVFGMPVDIVIKIGVFILIPIMNVIFLAYLGMTQQAM